MLLEIPPDAINNSQRLDVLSSALKTISGLDGQLNESFVQV